MSANRSFFDIKRFSVREAFWLAILVHLVFLLLPQSFNPFALFWRDHEPVAAEPITLRFREPEEQQTELTEQPEKQKAITTETRPEPPETDQPIADGMTNQKVFERPPQQQPRPRPDPQREQQPEKVEDMGEQRAEKPAEEPEPAEEQAPDPQREIRRERLRDALQEYQDRPINDVPLTFDNDRSTSAEEMEGTVQFDTYNWNYQPYQARMLRKIYREWVPKLYQIGFFRMGEAGRTVISFRIEQDGRVTALILRDGARIQSYDQAAQFAIEAPYPGLATEFPPLPFDFPKEFLGVTIGFYVNMEVPEQY